MESASRKMTIEELTDRLRRAAYIHFGQEEILALEELIRRYKYAVTRQAPEQ